MHELRAASRGALEVHHGAVVRGLSLTAGDLNGILDQDSDDVAVHSLAGAVWEHDGAELFGLEILAVAAA